MSSLTTLARPYAKAAFELARKDGDLAGWDERLGAAATAAAVPALADWLESPQAEVTQAVEILSAALGEKPGPALAGFLQVLAENDRLALLPEIHRLFGRLRERAEQRLSVRVVSAIELDEDQAGRMQKALARHFDCEIVMHNEIDPGVLGGAVIYAGDEVIDGSLKGRLQRLQGSLA